MKSHPWRTILVWNWLHTFHCIPFSWRLASTFHHTQWKDTNLQPFNGPFNSVVAYQTTEPNCSYTWNTVTFIVHFRPSMTRKRDCKNHCNGLTQKILTWTMFCIAFYLKTSMFQYESSGKTTPFSVKEIYILCVFSCKNPQKFWCSLVLTRKLHFWGLSS